MCSIVGTAGATVFHKDGDYTAFLDLLGRAKAKYPIKLFSVCLMPNHFHLVVQPATEAALSSFMQWWMTSHVRRYHRHYRSHGHVGQGRFKSFLIQRDGHLLTVLRYVLRNPVRAGLVEHAMDWPWSSLRFPHLSDPTPIETPTHWLPWIDQPLFDHELTTVAHLCESATALRDCGLANKHRDHLGPGVHAAPARTAMSILRKVACPLFFL